MKRRERPRKPAWGTGWAREEQSQSPSGEALLDLTMVGSIICSAMPGDLGPWAGVGGELLSIWEGGVLPITV